MRTAPLTILIFTSFILSACTTLPTPPSANINPSIQPTAVTQADTSTTLTGEVICLPKKGLKPGDMTTMECMYGIKTAESINYAISLPADAMMDVQTGQIYSMTGTLRQDPQSIYDIQGVLEVEDYAQAEE